MTAVVASSARQMRELSIEGCMGILAIFEAKPLLRLSRSINVFHNKKFTVLAIACLCSLDSLQQIRARGIHMEFKEILFLSKTFPRLKDGQERVIDRTDSDYLFDAMDIASDFELLEDLFWDKNANKLKLYRCSRNYLVFRYVFLSYLLWLQYFLAEIHLTLPRPRATPREMWMFFIKGWQFIYETWPKNLLIDVSL